MSEFEQFQLHPNICSCKTLAMKTHVPKSVLASTHTCISIHMHTRTHTMCAHTCTHAHPHTGFLIYVVAVFLLTTVFVYVKTHPLALTLPFQFPHITSGLFTTPPVACLPSLRLPALGPHCQLACCLRVWNMEPRPPAASSSLGRSPGFPLQAQLQSLLPTTKTTRWRQLDGGAESGVTEPRIQSLYFK